MGKSINKHGLKRYVPAKTRQKIRKEAGFGCVICGCAFIDYEHIEPEFSDAKEHDPDKMTLLCLDCHGRVSRKLISKSRVWNAKSNPKALQDGYVHDLLFTNTDNMEIEIGNSKSKKTKTILTINGKPIIWFEPPFIVNEPSKLCAIFHNEHSKASSYINRNQFIGLTDNQDIKSESTKIDITFANKKCLKIDRKGDAILKIINMIGEYLGTSVCIDSMGALKINHGGSSLTLSEIIVENCGSAINIGSIPAIGGFNKLNLSIKLINYSKVILDLNSSICGWKVGRRIINKKYQVVGVVNETKVYSLSNE